MDIRSRSSKSCIFKLALIITTFSVGLTNVQSAFHPADSNQDYTISLAEVTRYSAAYASGENWSVEPIEIPSSYVDQANFIWRNGETYHQLNNAPLPQAWVPAPVGGRTFAALSALSPEPLDFVEVFGIPDEITNLVAEVQIPGETEIYYSIVQKDSEDIWKLIMPLRKNSSDGGGSVNITLRNQEEFFPLGSINLSPLPAAEGAAEGAATDLVEIQEMFSDSLQYDLSFFQYYDPISLQYIPEETKVLALLDEIIRADENPNNLKNILEGTAPVLEEFEIEPALLDRIWAKTGISDYLNNFKSALSPLQQQQQAAPLQAQAFRFIDSNSSLPIRDLESLSDWMQKQCDSEVNTASGTERAEFMQNASDVNTVIGLMGPVGAAFSLGAGTTMYALDTYNQAMANLLPSDADLELVVSKPFFLEDNCETGQWEAFIHAKSKGWSMDKTLVTGAFKIYTGTKAVGSLKSAAASAEAYNKASNSSLDYADAITDTALSRYFPDDTSVLEIEPSYWNNIPVSDADLDKVQVEYLGKAIKESSLGKRYYEPAEVGTAGLKVVTVPGLLGCDAPSGTTEIIRVEENKVQLIPNSGEIRPEQQITFTAIVTDTEHKELAFGATHGEIISTTYNDATGVHQLVWKAPEEKDFPTEPIEITARSLTEECLRAGIVREFVGVFTGQGQDLVFGPIVECVQKGTEVTFSVQDLAYGEVPPVTWQLIGGGQLTPNGTSAVYKAPNSTLASVTVRATTIEEKPEVFEVTFMVDNCVEASATIIFNPDLSTQSFQTGVMLVDEAVDSGKFGTGDSFLLDGNITLSQADEEVIAGTMTGIGVAQREVAAYYEDPVNYPLYSSQDYSFYYPPFGGQYNYSLSAQIDEGVGPNDTYVEWLGGNEVKLYFDGSRSTVSPIFDEQLEIASWLWEFGDVTIGQGELVDHVYLIGPQFEFEVTLRITDNRGNISAQTRVFRIIQFDSEFSGSLQRNGISYCVSSINENDACEGVITMQGTRPGTLPQAVLYGAPTEDPDLYGIKLDFGDEEE